MGNGVLQELFLQEQPWFLMLSFWLSSKKDGLFMYFQTWSTFFLKKYQELEKDGKLRHVRVSNQGDIVAVAPSLGYCQTGVNLHVRENKEMVRGYSTDRSILGQLNLKALDMHNLDVYHERLFTNENSEDLCLDVAGLYEKYAGLKA